MTQQTADEQTTNLNDQKYTRIQSERYDSYAVARMAAQAMFRLLTNEAFAPESDLTTETHKIRVKRRVKNGKESFDVISYERIGLEKKEVKVHGPETFEAPAEEPVKKSSKKKKA